MRAADLAKAQAALAELEAAEMLAMRLGAGDPLRLTVGTAGNESGIVLSAGFEAELRGQLARGLQAKADAQRASLAAMGVEP